MTEVPMPPPPRKTGRLPPPPAGEARDGGSAEGRSVASEAMVGLVARRIRKRSVAIAGHRTSLSVEAAFWEALKEIAAARGLSVNRLIEAIDRARAAESEPGNLSSAVRVFVLETVRATGRRSADGGGP